METRTKSKNCDLPQKKSDGTLAKKIKLETCQMHLKSKVCRQNKIG